MNTAADFLSRLDLNTKKKVQFLIRDDIQTSAIEVLIQSSDVAEEDQFYFLSDDEMESEEQMWERKQRDHKERTTTQRQKWNRTRKELPKATVTQTETIKRSQDTKHQDAR